MQAGWLQHRRHQRSHRKRPTIHSARPQLQPCLLANTRAAHWTHSACVSSGLLGRPCPSSPIPFSDAKLTLRFVPVPELCYVTCTRNTSKYDHAVACEMLKRVYIIKRLQPPTSLGAMFGMYGTLRATPCPLCGHQTEKNESAQQWDGRTRVWARVRGCFVTVVAAFLLVFGTASVFHVQATWSAFVFVGLADPLRVGDLLPSRPDSKVARWTFTGTVLFIAASLLSVRFICGGASSLRLLHRSASHPPPRLPSAELPAPARGIFSCGGASGLRQPSGGSTSSPRSPSCGGISILYAQPCLEVGHLVFVPCITIYQFLGP